MKKTARLDMVVTPEMKEALEQKASWMLSSKSKIVRELIALWLAGEIVLGTKKLDHGG